MKKFTVLGIGESGRSAALFLKSQNANVYVSDSGVSDEILASAKELKLKGINIETGKHTKAFVEDSEFVVVSPGVPNGSVAIKWAKELGIEIISEIELGARFCKGKIVVVTGTNGKSTTVTLIEKILKSAKKDTVLCGNVGDAFCKYISRIKKDTIVVLEISSFQLEYIKTFSPYISVILNISQNHLDRHADMTEYLDAKKQIYKNQTNEDYLILNHDDKNLKGIENTTKAKTLFFSRNKKVKGAFFNKGSLFLNRGNIHEIIKVKDLRLRQPHNIENFLAASICASLCGVCVEDIQIGLKQFKGLKHRMQHVGAIDGIDFYDDSKATTVDATKAALSSIDNPVVLIAGGRNKGSDFKLAQAEIKNKVKTLIAIGEAANEIKHALCSVVPVKEACSMDEAVGMAVKIAKKGESVLLSPMCASFDMYKSYKDRGGAFIDSINKIKAK